MIQNQLIPLMKTRRRHNMISSVRNLLVGSLGMLALVANSAAHAQNVPAPLLRPAILQPSAPVVPVSAPIESSDPEAAPYWNWFRFHKSILKTWQINAVAGEMDAVIAKPIRLGLVSPQRKVLVVYPRASSAYDVSITKILSVFEDKQLDVMVKIVNFRLNDVLGKKLIQDAEADGYDLIFSMGSESTAWLWGTYRNGKLPVVTVCSKDPVVLGQTKDYESGSGINFAFTSLNMPMDVQMAYMHDLKPKLRNIAVLVDSKNISAVETQAKPVIQYAKRRGIRVLEIAISDPSKAREELAELVGVAARQMQRNDPDLQNSVFWLTGSTSVFKEIETINKFAGRVPVISVVPELVKDGDNTAVVSIGISFESNAHLAAIYAGDILAGRKRAGDLRVGVVSPPDIAVSFRKVRDIGMTVPLSMFEAAGTIYDYDGKAVRIDGANVKKAN
jgi:putative tryptophan/tyrosine transport system substrate-binding protein